MPKDHYWNCTRVRCRTPRVGEGGGGVHACEALVGWQYMSPLSRCKRIPSRSRHHQNGTRTHYACKVTHVVLRSLPLTLDNPVSVTLANRVILYASRCLLLLRECSDTGQFAGKCLMLGNSVQTYVKLHRGVSRAEHSIPRDYVKNRPFDGIGNKTLKQ